MKRGIISRKKLIFKSVVIFAVLLTFVVVFWIWQRSAYVERAESIAAQVAGYIQTRIEDMQDSADVLSAWLDIEGDDVKKTLAESADGKEYREEFERMAQSLYDENSMTSVQLLPNGVVRYVYPIEGNETLIGSNITEGEEAPLLEEAAKENKLAVTGPYFVAKIGLGLNFRMPVYYSDGTLWGYTSLTMRLPDALEPLALSRLTDLGYDYELRYVIDNDTGKTDRIGGTVGLSEDTATFVFQIAGTHWKLSVRPISGWINAGTVFLTVLAAMLIAFVLAWVVEYRSASHDEAINQLRSDARHDKMTSLLNHTASAEAIDKVLATVEGGVLLLIDVDNFKEVNDSAGHLAGDKVLIEVADAMRTTFRRHDILGRYGGDEFIVYMLGDISIPDFSVKASQLQRKIRKIPVGNTGNFVTCSIGAARRCVETPTAETLVRRADQALYVSKGNGKDRYTIFDDSESTVIVTPQKDESELDHDYVISE